VFHQANEIMKDPESYNHLGFVYKKLNQFDKSRKYWNLSLELNPDQDEIRNELINLDHSQASR
jgi:Flp pilus assembly protein TadD